MIVIANATALHCVALFLVFHSHFLFPFQSDFLLPAFPVSPFQPISLFILELINNTMSSIMSSIRSQPETPFLSLNSTRNILPLCKIAANLQLFLFRSALYRRLLKIRPWVMNLSGCSKRGVGVFSRTSLLKIGPPHSKVSSPYLKVGSPYLKVGPTPSTQKSRDDRSVI